MAINFAVKSPTLDFIPFVEVAFLNALEYRSAGGIINSVDDSRHCVPILVNFGSVTPEIRRGKIVTSWAIRQKLAYPADYPTVC